MPDTWTQTIVTTDTALRIIAIALSEGEEAGVKVSATVVDPAMGLIAFARADGATPHSVETSRRKAITAASTRRASGWIPSELELMLPIAAGNLLTNVTGGVPLVLDGEHAGGLGIAGGTPAQDAEIAQATLAALARPA
jgi:glc operon protein GlcG